MKSLLIEKTPIEVLPNVSAALGCRVYVKREEFCHTQHGGNKARKLAYTLDGAGRLGATDLITVGAWGSNHVWATAFHARAFGFAVHAVVLPHPPRSRSQAVAAETLRLGVNVIPAKNDFDLLWRVWCLRRELVRQGRRPYVIPPGGSSALSSQGYVDAVREVVDQADGLMDASFCAVGSGGTLAGILAGTLLLDLPWTVFGVSAKTGFAQSKFWIWNLARLTLRHLKSGQSVPFSKIHILKSAIGAGYGEVSLASQAAVDLFQKDGVTLDDTYTAKAAAGMIEQVKEHPEWKSVLLWLTQVPIAPSSLEVHSPETRLSGPLMGE